MPLTEDAQRVLQRSAQERYSVRHDLVTSGHLVLAILGEKESAAGAFLKRYGIQREQIITRLPDSSEEEGPGPDITPDMLF